MSDPPATTPAPRVDAVALARLRLRLARAAQPPWLHAEVARRMAARIPLFKQPPQTVLDWGCRIGGSGQVLRSACPQARIVAVEADADMPTGAVAGALLPWWSPRRWRAPVAAPAVPPTAVAPDSAQLLWCNMGLHFEFDPQAQFARWHVALAADGMLLFSTLGPGTLAGLRAIYRRHGWPSPHAPFVDMHDLGDQLVHAGFADPVMDQETVTLTWPGADALLAELRGLGGNADPARFAGLRTPRWRQRLAAALAQAAQTADGGRPALEFEIVYGHAVKPRPRVRVQPQATIALAEMRAMVGARRRGTGEGDGSLR